MTDYTQACGLDIAGCLHELVDREIAPGTGIASEQVWKLLAEIVSTLGPRHAALLAERDRLQAEIDAWLRSHTGNPPDSAATREFLTQIGYLIPEGPPFTVTTANVDDEIAVLAGPQLVVPVDNARYALNAANARWGSLYDALYGTNVIGTVTSDSGTYDAERGGRVIEYANGFLDSCAPLQHGSWQQVTALSVHDGRLNLDLSDGTKTALRNADAFAGYRDADGQLTHVLLVNHGLHLELVIDPEHPIGRQHPAGVRDVVLESAISTIMDCEDSVAAVDAEDKARVYGNWNGIMRGTLTATLNKGGRQIERTLQPDRQYTAPDGSQRTLPGRSLMLVRHVGGHLLTDAVRTADGAPIPETFLDCVITALAAIHDLKRSGPYRNSRTGSVYIVKPKQHGPAEVALSVALFAAVEQGLGLPANTLKIGIMDEERRTTINLMECIRAAAERVIFINTGFLDRTGDEIHTSMEAGPVTPKPAIKGALWMQAYEDWNVRVGLEAGLPGHAQIGKGMWAVPDDMKSMLDTKQAHPLAGASCAWVPSPTAATLHAMHYHSVDVAERQRQLGAGPKRTGDDLLAILTPPMLGSQSLTADEIRRELDNNAQSILGYVVRWVEQGIGCSKVPDVNNIGLMEDRATLRISSQHIANWLHHGLVTQDQVVQAMQRMATIVDRQNAGDTGYRPMSPDYRNSIAFQAAIDLILHGTTEPNGYTEPVLGRRRREFKARAVAQRSTR